MQATHCTGDHTCFSSNDAKSAACSCTCASTLETIRYRSVAKGVALIAFASSGPTGRMAGEWEVAQLRRGRTRFAPPLLSAAGPHPEPALGPALAASSRPLAVARTDPGPPLSPPIAPESP